MNCPSCNKENLNSLSVCPSCGADTTSTPLEELGLRFITPTKTVDHRETAIPTPPPAPVQIAIEPVKPKCVPTAEIFAKSTSPTLKEFQNKNSDLPDWRLQMQMAARSRVNKASIGIGATATASVATLAAPELPITAEIPGIAPPANDTLLKALKRIDDSRRTFFIESNAASIPVADRPVTYARKNPPILPVAASPIDDMGLSGSLSETDELEISTVRSFDTNKLPPISTVAKISSSFSRPAELIENEHTTSVEEPDVVAYQQIEMIDTTDEADEVDDCAPLALRANAAIFDLLICSFGSFILMLPFMIMTGRIFSIEGVFAFIAICAIVTFIYMTTSIGFTGRTFGMKLFGLEIIDAEENEYPTLHQAAVSSALYLVSLVMLGAGFLTVFITEEKRAVHDLVSGTVIVKEFV